MRPLINWHPSGKHLAPGSRAGLDLEHAAVLLYLSNGWRVDVLNGHGRHRA